MNTKKLQQTTLLVKKAIFMVMAFLVAFSANAQTPGDLDLPFVPQGNFQVGTGFGTSIVRAVALQGDGKILVGGQFSSYNGTTVNRIARLNVDGTLDTSFDTGTGFGVGEVVHAIAVQYDGKILVGGDFTSYNGTTKNRLVRLNSDGTLDTSFDTGTGFNGTIYAIAVQSDGKILVGGEFSSFGIFTNTRDLVRLEPNGTFDHLFYLNHWQTAPGAGLGFNGGYVRAITIRQDGKILIGGSFTSYNTFDCNRIICLNANGSLDTTFSLGAGFEDNSSFPQVNSMAIQPDGKIMVGGEELTTYDGQVINKNILRLNTDGTLDTTFDTTGSGFAYFRVNSIIIQPTGKLVVGGSFANYNDTPISNNIVRLNNDGTIDESMFGAGFNEEVFALAQQFDGDIVVGGWFSDYNGMSYNRIIRTDSNGNLRNGFNNNVLSTLVQPDGKIIVTGDFTSYNLSNSNYLTRLDENGEKDLGFADFDFNDKVQSIALQTDGKIVVGGKFTFSNGLVRNRLLRMEADGTLDNSFNSGAGFNEQVTSVALQTDGKLIVAGDFTSLNGQTRNRIVRLFSNGTLDNSFNIGTGFNGIVTEIALQTDGKVLVTGEFTSYKGENCNSLVRLNSNGTLDTSFNTGIGFNNSVHTIALQLDGKILAGGDFIIYNGQAHFGMVRINTDGSPDTGFNIGAGFTGSVKEIAVQSNGRIFVGGDFTAFNNQPYANFVALLPDGTVDDMFYLGYVFNNTVKTITVQSDSKILVGGDFTIYDEFIGRHLVRLYGDNSTLSIDDPEFQSSIAIKAYPNPVKDILNLSSHEPVNSIIVTDLSGRTVYQNNYGNTEASVDFSAFPDGLYLVKASVGSHAKTIKISKK